MGHIEFMKHSPTELVPYCLVEYIWLFVCSIDKFLITHFWMIYSLLFLKEQTWSLSSISIQQRHILGKLALPM